MWYGEIQCFGVDCWQCGGQWVVGEEWGEQGGGGVGEGIVWVEVVDIELWYCFGYVEVVVGGQVGGDGCVQVYGCIVVVSVDVM